MKIFINFDSINEKLKTISFTNDKICGININPLDFPFAEIIDLKRKFLSCGFIDSHTHFLHSALEKSYTNLNSAKNNKDIIELMKKSTKNIGYGYDSSSWLKEPNKDVLNEISKTEPIFIIKKDYHSGIANDTAIKKIKIPKELQNPETQNGIFKGRAFISFSRIISSQFTESDREEAFFREEKIAFSKGVTTIHALEGGDGWGYEDIEFMIKKEKDKNNCHLNVILYPQIVNINWVKERNLKRIGGCLLLDGSFGSRTASLLEPYSDGPQKTGELYFSDRALMSFIERSHKLNLQTAFHAIGDRATKQLADIYDKVLTKYPSKNSRHRIEHCELATDETLEKLSKNNIQVSVQPIFEYFWGENMYRKRLGNRITNRYKDMLKLGLNLAGGSDFNVTEINPILGIYSAVNHPTPTQRISIKEAYDMFTKNASFLSYDENSIGSIDIGKNADFVILSENPLKLGKSKIKDIKVIATYRNGELVY